MGGLLGNESLEPPSKPALQPQQSLQTPEQGGPLESGPMCGRAEWAGDVECAFTWIGREYTHTHTSALSNKGQNLSTKDVAFSTKPSL